MPELRNIVLDSSSTPRDMIELARNTEHISSRTVAIHNSYSNVVGTTRTSLNPSAVLMEALMIDAISEEFDTLLTTQATLQTNITTLQDKILQTNDSDQHYIYGNINSANIVNSNIADVSLVINSSKVTENGLGNAIQI